MNIDESLLLERKLKGVEVVFETNEGEVFVVPTAAVGAVEAVCDGRRAAVHRLPVSDDLADRGPPAHHHRGTSQAFLTVQDSNYRSGSFH